MGTCKSNAGGNPAMDVAFHPGRLLCAIETRDIVSTRIIGFLAH